jgi:hypothetical protein
VVEFAVVDAGDERLELVAGEAKDRPVLVLGVTTACCKASAVRSSVQVGAVARASVVSGTLVVASAARVARA